MSTSDSSTVNSQPSAVSRVHLAFFLAAILTLFFIPGMRMTYFGERLDSYCQDICHFPLFAAISAALLAWRRPGGNHISKACAVAVTAVGIAASVELIQPYFGRTAAWDDLFLGAAGTMSLLSVYVALRSASETLKRCLVVVATLLFMIAMLPLVLMFTDRFQASRAFPVVDSFERATEIGRWVPEGCEVMQVREHATHGRYSLRMIVDGTAAYPSIFLSDGVMDWRGYKRFAVDVYLKGDASRLLWIRADDSRYPHYDDRAQTTVELKPGNNTVWIDLGPFIQKPNGKKLDLSHILSVGLFLDHPKAGDTIYIDKLVLSAKPRA